MLARIVEKESTQMRTSEETCKYLQFDERDEGYCHASDVQGPMACMDADYGAKSYYPPCMKSWFKGKTPEENRKIYDEQFRGK
jgi:hypothetical protein